MRYRDRTDAGRAIARELTGLSLRAPLVLGLPRGGVPVAAEVATTLEAPLDVFVARKVGAPGHVELGMGAVAEGGTRLADRTMLDRLGVTDADFAERAEHEEATVVTLVARYRAGRPLPPLGARDVVLVDDGLATGVTAQAALTALRTLGPARLILAAPVGAGDTAVRLAELADRVLCAYEPEPFDAVGAWYEDFSPTTDDEVLDLLRASSHR